ncbi:MAG: ComEC/Rec2 family competence protein [Pyrinomonadaceae bacterium]|nr:ComEC/Rec2 family competence protein [Pyrinomonadaceae bacterium]
MQTAPHQQPFVAHPLAQLAAAFAVGILGSHSFSATVFLLLLACLLASLLSLICLCKCKPGVATAFLTIAFLLAGAGLGSIEKRSVSSDRLKVLIDSGTIAAGQPVELTGALERNPESAPGAFYLTLRAEQLRMNDEQREISGVVTLLLPVREKVTEEDYQRLELRYGARVRVMTVLNRADSFRNPGVSTFTEYLERRGYDAAGYVKSPLLIERLDDQRVFLPIAWLYQWRQRLEAQIVSRFSRETAGVLLASLLGNRYFLSQATAERFREGGTFHVLVISGLHISFIGGMVFLLARRVTRNRSWQFLLATTVLWCYGLAVGAEASVVRAALMFTLIAFAPIVSRRGASLNSLGASALVLLVWRPGDLFDPAFQLTFLSVLAIVVFGWPLLQRISQIGLWRPTRETPNPPLCPAWLRSFSESLFWSDRNWKTEMARLNYSYKLFKTPLAGTLERYHLQRPLRYALGATVVSFCVQITMLPLLIVYFHRVSVPSLILNIVVSVLMATLAVAAVSGLILAQVSTFVATPLFGLANALNWLMTHSVDPLTRLGIASSRLPEYSGWLSLIYLGYCLPLMVLAVSLSRWHPLGPALENARRIWRVAQIAILTQVILIAFVIVHPFSAGRTDGRLRVDFLDVGQGDSALITMPDGTTLLVDGGGTPNFFSRKGTANADDEEPFVRDTRSVGEAVVSEYLWYRGLDRIDYLVATHADADHIDGLNDVARNFDVRGALVARTPRNDSEFAKFYDTANARGIPIAVVVAGDVLRFTSTTATVLWPRASARPETQSRNNDSIVLRLQFGERSILLTGDIERLAEAAVLSADLGVPLDVVKVAHHGSKTSSTDALVSATRPKFAIISVGQNSIFGHPHREVVERWQNNGAEVLTTGKSGLISVTIDGKDLRLETFVTAPGP